MVGLGCRLEVSAWRVKGTGFRSRSSTFDPEFLQFSTTTRPLIRWCNLQQKSGVTELQGRIAGMYLACGCRDDRYGDLKRRTLNCVFSTLFVPLFPFYHKAFGLTNYRNVALDSLHNSGMSYLI